MAATQVSRGSKITDALRVLRTSTPDIVGAVVVNMEGFVVASLLPSDVDEELIAGMAASLLGVGERISADLMGANMEQIYARSPKGYIVLQAISGEAALVLLVTREAKLGLIFLEIKRIASELARIV
ncbi:MAG: roadblock/LC7 domain-containing protein [Kofleriaceae bacterium]|nr:roadblock/LC7 domain-containing protein [Kofleriaceae bacterium]